VSAVTAAFVDSPHGLVVVNGDDSTSFLQSLVSQDLETIGDGESKRSLLLTPQGKLDVVFRITLVGDEWWLDTEADHAPRLAASLTRFRIRVKAEIEDRTEATGMLSLIGGRTGGEPEGMHAIATTWGDTDGVDLLGSIAATAEVLERLDSTVPRWTREQFEVFRIEHGMPRQGIDIDEKTIPQEAFLDRDAVSFTKGCFLGQELVARIDSRGHVNRYLRRLRVDGSDVPPRGATVVVGEKDVGAVTSAASVPGEDRAVALGMIRREVEPPATVTLRWDDREVSAAVW
jgi:folate-binding protein YgfZ